MNLAFDTYYFGDKAKTVCIAFNNWTDSEVQYIYEEVLENIEAYKSGEFYKRELPCILSLLRKIPVNDVNVIVIDGFVYLDDHNKYGLGGHMYESLEQKIPIIGVAKSNFATIMQNKRQVIRGKSLKPLYITAIGIDIDKASELIKTMHGEFRMPTLLKRLDSLTREK